MCYIYECKNRQWVTFMPKTNEQLELFLIASKLSKEQLAKMANLSLSTLQRALYGKNISRKSVSSLSKALSKSVPFELGEDDIRNIIIIKNTDNLETEKESYLNYMRHISVSHLISNFKQTKLDVRLEILSEMEINYEAAEAI